MSKGNGRIKRLLAGSVIGLTGLAFAPGSAGAVVDTAEFCAAAADYDTGFTDIAAAGVHEDNVTCLAFSGITSGTTATTYSPQNNVTRGQMATFIANMIDTANDLDAAGAPELADLPDAAAAADAFTDDEGNTHEDNINRLAEAGVVAGTSATTFEPNANVSRAQMASFIAQGVEFLTGAPLDEGTDAFTDDETSVHEANINRLATAEIVGGIGGGLYNPAGLVSRAQMGSFIIQGLAALHADGVINALAPAAGENNFDFTVDRTGPVVAEIEADGEASETFVFSGFGEVDEVDIAQVPCYYTVVENGAVSLVDDYDGEGEFYYTGDSNSGDSFISEVNGDDDNTQYFAEAEVVDDTLEVDVSTDSDNGDCSFLFVFADTEDDDYIEVDLGNVPTEAFAAVGPILFHSGEAPNGQGPCGDILWNDTTDADGHAGWFVVDDDGCTDDDEDFLYFYDDEDVFTYDHDFTLTMGEFESLLTNDDYIDYDDEEYSQTATNEFSIDDDYGYPDNVPTDVTATTGDFDDVEADTGANDVLVEFEAPASGILPAYYCVEAYSTAGTETRNDDVYEFTSCTTTDADEPGVPSGDPDVDTDGSDTDILLLDVAQDSYRFYVAVWESQEGTGYSPYSDASAITTVAAAPVGSPWSMFATFQDTDTNGLVSVDDILTLNFSEVMAAPANGDTITLQDGDGTTGDVICGVNATCALDGVNPAIIHVTIDSAPSISQAGDDPGIAYGSAEVVARSGFEDLNQGLPWDIVSSPDTTF